MTSTRTAAHAAPQSTRYLPERVNFAQHRKPNRRGLGWHVHTLIGEVIADGFEWYRRPRKPL